MMLSDFFLPAMTTSAWFVAGRARASYVKYKNAQAASAYRMALADLGAKLVNGFPDNKDVVSYGVFFILSAADIPRQVRSIAEGSQPTADTNLPSTLDDVREEMRDRYGLAAEDVVEGITLFATLFLLEDAKTGSEIRKLAAPEKGGAFSWLHSHVAEAEKKEKARQRAKENANAFARLDRAKEGLMIALSQGHLAN